MMEDSGQLSTQCDEVVRASLSGFRKLVKTASDQVGNLSFEELPVAFQISFGLMESISEVMIGTFDVLKSRCNMDKNDITEITCSRPCSSFTEKTHSGQSDEENRIECRAKQLPEKPQGSPQSDIVKRKHSAELDGDPECIYSTTSSSRRIQKSNHHSDVTESSESCSNGVSSQSDCSPNVNVQQIMDMKPFKSSNGHISSVADRNSCGTNSTKTVGDVRRWRLASTDRLNTLIDECERQINGRKLYVCKFCGKVYEIKSSMRYHMKIIHLQMHLRTTEMQCRICGKQFTCVSAVNRHQAKCILTTYPDPGPYRPKQSSTSSGNPYAGATKDRLFNNTLGPEIFVQSSNNTDDNSSVNTALPYSSVQRGLSNTFMNPFSSSISLNSNNTAPCFPLSTPTAFGAYHRSQSMEDKDEPTSPGFGTPSINARRRSAEFIPTGWPSLPQFGNNLSELTSLQLEMCMKAVVQGFQNKVNTLCNTPQMHPTNEVEQNGMFEGTKSEELSNNVCNSDTHRSSFSSAHTPSDASEVDQSPPILDNDDVAMDLSSRSHTESVMIESF